MVTNAYFEEGGIFKPKLGTNSYKKSGKMGLELNFWINPGSLAKTTSGAPNRTEFAKMLD